MTENIPPGKICYVQFNRIIIIFLSFPVFFFRPHQMEWNSWANLLVATSVTFILYWDFLQVQVVPNIMSFAFI